MADDRPIPGGARISDHLSWAEATATQHRDRLILEAQRDPPPLIRANLRRLAVDVFEPARAIVGRLLVTSGYRCPALNRAVGGAKTSAHMDGRALDLVPLDLDLREAFTRIAQSGTAFDQLIWEFGRWIHLGGAPHAVEPRRQILAYYAPGDRAVVWNPRDPRFA